MTACNDIDAVDHPIPVFKTNIPVVQLDATDAAAFKYNIEHDLKELSEKDAIGQFQEESHARLQQVLSREAELLLHNMVGNSKSSSVVLLKGFPVEDDLPPTLTKPPVKKNGFLAEAILYGLAHIWGKTATYKDMTPAMLKPPVLGEVGTLKDLVTTDQSSSMELKMHRDFALAPDTNIPEIRLIHCLRPDKARQVQTRVADGRDVVRQLDFKDVHLLRTFPVQFRTASGQQMGCSKLVITGSDEHPILSLLEIAFLGKGAYVTADDPAAVEAYHRASDLAMRVAAGVKLEEGDVLCIHNGRALHARTESPHEADGYGRWLKVTLVMGYDRIARMTSG